MAYGAGVYDDGGMGFDSLLTGLPSVPEYFRGRNLAMSRIVSRASVSLTCTDILTAAPEGLCTKTAPAISLKVVFNTVVKQRKRWKKWSEH